jgi:hypothetical protein
MSLVFPSGPAVDDVCDPGNGIRYRWTGNQWDEVDTKLLTQFPIDVDKDVDDEIRFNIDLTLLTSI